MAGKASAAGLVPCVASPSSQLSFWAAWRIRYSMSMTVEQIAEEALALSSDARALLADRLVESLDPAEDEAIRVLWAKEAIRRRDEIRSGKVQAVPGEEALAQVRRSIGR
jgi:hypothetical protein